MRFVIVEGRSQGQATRKVRGEASEPWDATPPTALARSGVGCALDNRNHDNFTASEGPVGGTPPHGDRP